MLDFVKLHPLMFEEVQPAGGEPLLVKRSVAYSRLAVDRVQALDGRSYDVLFMGTGECRTWDGSPRGAGGPASPHHPVCRGRLAAQGRGAGLQPPHHRGGAGVPGPAARGDAGGVPQTGEGRLWGWGWHGAPHVWGNTESRPFPSQRSLYVGAASGVLQVPLASCARYSSCYDCILARDPYCAWDGWACRDTASGDR